MSATVRWRRLGWAGVEVQADGASVVIDPLLDPGVFSAFMSEDREGLIAPDEGRALAALVTHLHRDHADIATIEHALADDGVILCPPPSRQASELDEVATGEAEAALAARSSSPRPLEPGESATVGPFTITALAASDGLGSPQVSWLIEIGGRKLLHAGDTVWHGGWWNIAAVHGPVDVAFLPANGVEVAYPGWEPAVGVPAVMTPEQAVEAARALQARTLVPIHFDRTFEHPKYYRPVADARLRVENAASAHGVEARFTTPGSWLELPS